MHEGDYGLGIDIGDDTVTAAVCRAYDGDTEPRPLHLTTPEAPLGLMARVGTPVPLYSGGRGVPAAEVAAAIVHRVRSAAEAQEARPPGWTVLAIPASWGAHRSAVLARALEAAGDADVSMVSGALTATYHHVRSGDLPADVTVAVYDLGAGTLDTAVVGPGADGGLDHVAVPPRPLEWGGRDVDDALLAHVLRWSEEPGSPSAPADRERALALRARAVTAKEALSTETVTALETDAGAPLRVTREELDELIDDDVRASVAGLAATIGAAGRSAADLHAVVLAGGAVRTPLVGERISAELDLPLVVGDDPETTVALGAARLAAETLGGASGAVGGSAAQAADDAPLETAAAPADARGMRPPGGTVRRPGDPGRRPARGPRTGARAVTGPASGRRSARALVVAGMFAALLLVPTMSAVLSTTIGAAPADSVARAGGPAGTTASAAGAQPTTGSSAEAGVSMAAAVQEDPGTRRSRESASDGSRTPGATKTTEPSTAAGTGVPTASGTGTAGPASTAGAPAATAPTAPGGSTPPPSSAPADPPVETTDPPAETTDPPVETTDPPVATTDPPVETTEPPAGTTPPADPSPPPAETSAATDGQPQ